MHTGDIWIIDENKDEQEMIADVLGELKLKNEIVFLTSPAEVFKKFEEVSEAPFIIFCDVNLPEMNGFELRQALLDVPSKMYHSVPYIFWSTFASEAQITRAYDLAAHGFFVKESSLKELRNTFMEIIRYWQKSKMPAKKRDK